MTLEIMILAAPIVGLALYFGYGRAKRVLRERRRDKWMASPLSEASKNFLLKYYALYRDMPVSLQHHLSALIQVFINEKRFVGCAGLEVTPEMRLLISAQACTLILKRPHDFYSSFQSILIYPDAYVAQHEDFDGLVRSESEQFRAGESWHRGPLILSWRNTLEGALDGEDGMNVVMHEFAHKLDEDHTGVDGLPRLMSADQYPDWARVLTEAYEAHCRAIDRGEQTLIDPYGASAPEEFFAVVTECFFERSRELEAEHPELYEQFRRCYGLEPAKWAKPAL